MSAAPTLWFARVEFDGLVVLHVSAPLIVVTGALTNTFAMLDAIGVYQSSRLNVEVRPL